MADLFFGYTVVANFMFLGTLITGLSGMFYPAPPVLVAAPDASVLARLHRHEHLPPGGDKPQE
jgi:hypothetical protein